MEYLFSTSLGASGLLGSTMRNMQSFGTHLKDHIVPHARNSYQPHILHHRTLGLFSFLLLSVKLSVILVTSFVSPDSAFSSAITPNNIFALTNSSRTDFGLPALRYNDVLASAAQAKANDMLDKGYFAHTSPDGKSPWEFIKGAGYSYMTAGENLAWGFPQDCAECVDDAWMNSPGHKANIVNQYFEEIGVGIAQGTYEGYSSTFVVQMFGTPLAPNISLNQEPTVVQKPALEPKPAAPVKEDPKPSAQQQVVPAPETPLHIQEVSPVVTIPAESTSTAEELKILRHSVSVDSGFVKVFAETSNSASKAIVGFSGKSVLMKAVGEREWQALIPSSLIGNSSVSVSAYDIRGTSVSEQVANFTTSLTESYGTKEGNVKGESITVFGKTFNPKAIEYQFYLLFAAAVLTCMVIAIAVHRHIQHVPMIANSSFVVILAMLLWIG